MVKEGEEAPRVTGSTVMDKLEATIMLKVNDIQDRIQRSDNPDELQKLTAALSELLGSLEKVKRIKKS